MKLMVLVDRLDHAGGLERSLANKVQSWCNDGFQVHIVTLDQHGPDFYPIDCRARRVVLGVTYDHSVPLHAATNVRAACRNFTKLRSTILNVQPTHIVHCGYGYDFYFLPLIARNAFLVKENHSSRYQESYSQCGLVCRVKQNLRRWFDARYDASVFLSLEEAHLSGVKNATVIPNALDDRIILERRREKRIVAAGRICAVKGFDRLIDAWALAAPRLPEWRLEIYGDGTESNVSALQQRVRTLGLSESVSLHSSTPQIIERMAESGILAMTSRSECFPMVLLEAMQVGLPIVAYDCPTGPRNIIVNGSTGILVQDGNATAFADALVRIAMDPEEARVISSNARRESLRYASSEIARLWRSLLNSSL